MGERAHAGRRAASAGARDQIKEGETVRLPIVVNGVERHPDGARETITLEYTHGLRVELPAVTDEELAQILANRERLERLTLADVTEFLAAAGKRWIDLGDPLRKEAVSLCQRITGLGRMNLERDYLMIGRWASARHNFYDLLDAELGDHHILDHWVRRQVVKVRAFPRGRSLHVLVGNVPAASIYSLMRSVLTKNQTVIKLPARDPVTCLYFVRVLLETHGPRHPLCRALSVLYWPRRSEVFDRLVQGADCVCAWGQGESLQQLKRRIPHDVPYLELGPKRSFSVVWTAGVDLDKAAMRVVHDVVVYDQEACFSPQRLFVIGERAPLVERLKHWFAAQRGFLPRGRTSPDVDSHVHRTRLEAHYRGWPVHAGEDAAWTVIECDEPYAVREHPLSRTLFVHGIERPEEVLPFVDDETQTIAVYPHDERVERLADLFCGAGALRVVECGMVSHFREGFTHDGAYPLHHFVRLAHIDAPLDYFHKYGDYGKYRALERREDLFYGARLGREPGRKPGREEEP